MVFEKKYTPEMVLGAIEKYGEHVYGEHVRTWQIAETMGCSIMTVDRLLGQMLKDGLITRINKGSRGINVWLYSRCGT